MKQQLMKETPMKNDEKDEKNEGKMINVKRKRVQHRGAYPARAIRRLQRGSHMNLRTGRTVPGASGAFVGARWGRIPDVFPQKVEWH